MGNDVWIDDASYFGPERRAGGSGLRIFDRRRRPGPWTPPPSLPTIIRQLKSSALGLYGPTQWARFQVRLEGAIGLAERHGEIACKMELARLLHSIRNAPHRSAVTVTDVELSLERARNIAERLPPT